MLTTTYGESGTSTPIFEMGEPIGPDLPGGNHEHGGAAYHGACEQFGEHLPHLRRIFPVVGGTSFFSVGEQMKVRSSTRATSAGSERTR